MSRPDLLDAVAECVLKDFVQIGLPYLEKYSVMENALELLSRDDRAYSIHSPRNGDRAKRAIGLAFLLHRLDLFRTLTEAKTIFLRERNDPDLQSFMSFRQKLERRFHGV